LGMRIEGTDAGEDAVGAIFELNCATDV